MKKNVEKYNLKYFEVSAKTGKGINEIFDFLVNVENKERCSIRIRASFKKKFSGFNAIITKK